MSLGLEPGFVWTKAFPGPGRPCPLSVETSGQLYEVWLGTISRRGGRVLCIGSLSPALCPRGAGECDLGIGGRGGPWYTRILAAKSRRKVSAPDSYFSAASGRCQAPLLFIVRTEAVPASELTRNGTSETDLSVGAPAKGDGCGFSVSCPMGLPSLSGTARESDLVRLSRTLSSFSPGQRSNQLPWFGPM